MSTRGRSRRNNTGGRGILRKSIDGRRTGPDDVLDTEEVRIV